MTMTTTKVPGELRDRLALEAGERGTTAVGYLAETALWAATDPDGLDA